MLVGQWQLDLVGLERKLQNELDEGHSFLQRTETASAPGVAMV